MNHLLSFRYRSLIERTWISKRRSININLFSFARLIRQYLCQITIDRLVGWPNLFFLEIERNYKYFTAFCGRCSAMPNVDKIWCFEIAISRQNQFDEVNLLINVAVVSIHIGNRTLSIAHSRLIGIYWAIVSTISVDSPISQSKFGSNGFCFFVDASLSFTLRSRCSRRRVVCREKLHSHIPVEQ